jgi:hypothetical protein
LIFDLLIATARALELSQAKSRSLALLGMTKRSKKQIRFARDDKKIRTEKWHLRTENLIYG